MVRRPVPFWLSLCLAGVDLGCFAWLPPRNALFADACFASLAVTGGILFWMLVLVRGAHGPFGRLVGVEHDRSLRFPPSAWLLFLAGAGLIAIGIDRQRERPDALALFCCGVAIAAAGSTQSRRQATS